MQVVTELRDALNANLVGVLVFVPAVERFELPLVCSNLRGGGVRLVVVKLKCGFHVPVSSLQSRNGRLLPEGLKAGITYEN